ncbi:hypothetical protein [Streptomyces sp. 8N706]|uniref:hypothetical protein n=1 Tax=Streptomyces sp. 8N706 TaxID=3457416 RepID=UPI003FD2AE63
MSARTPSAPAQTRTPPPAGRDPHEIRLPWWSVALPAMAFAVLLMLPSGASDAHAATGSPSAVAQVLERIQEVLAHRGA